MKMSLRFPKFMGRIPEIYWDMKNLSKYLEFVKHISKSFLNIYLDKGKWENI